jgi:hypothetical protein
MHPHTHANMHAIWLTQACTHAFSRYVVGYGNNSVSPNTSETATFDDNSTLVITYDRVKWTNAWNGITVSLPTRFDGVNTDSGAGFIVYELASVRQTFL